MVFRRRNAGQKAGLLKPLLAALGLVGVTSAGLAGCGLGAQSAPQALNPKSVPYGLLGATTAPSTSVPSLVSARVTMFLEGSDERLVPVHRQVAWPATISAILGELAAGPTARESDRGLVSPASAVGPFGVGPVRDGVVSVDLPVSFENLDGQGQTVAAAQIVFTVTTFTGVTGVRFLVAGQTAQVPNGNGSLTAGPSTRKDYLAFAS
ncbi:MAG TPA: GerMN domain-containing protein [Acidimicrobiales bacterium]|nr:GerMN domain-containing protein [Acidimicrobiales bacterium]